MFSTFGKWIEHASTKRLLLVLLAIDTIFVLLHLAHFKLRHFGIEDPLLSIEQDHGYAEIYQYMKELWTITALIALATARREFRYLVWILLCIYIFLDDAIQIHETVGTLITRMMTLNARFGLRGQDFGELIVSASVIGIFLSILVPIYRRASMEYKEISRNLFWLLSLLAFFGVFVDMLHIAIKAGWQVNLGLGIAEDGGEMVAMSVISTYVYWLNFGRLNDIKSVETP